MKIVTGLLIGALCQSVIFLPTIRAQANDRVTFEDDSEEEHREGNDRDKNPAFLSSVGESPIFPENNDHESAIKRNRTRDGKNLFDWFGFGTSKTVDPYIAKTNEACLTGDLAECFKSRALTSFADFFDQPEYFLNDNVKVVRMSRDIVQEVNRQPYEYSGTARAGESEWDQLTKFAARKAEKFIKTVALEVKLPAWVTGENEEYAPRFLDEIADEIETLENKKDSIVSRLKLKSLFIPMLLVLKVFKLKLLLFLPFILGLASFKKFLGFLALVIPGVIAFLKFYKPMHSYQPPIYTQNGIATVFPHYKDSSSSNVYPGEFFHESPPKVHDNPGYQNSYQNDGSFGQDIAYQGYRTYRNSQA